MRARMPRIRTLITDFDETITTHDTITLIGSLPYRKETKPFPWSHYFNIYLEAFNSVERPARDVTLREKITKENFYTLFRKELEYQKALTKVDTPSLEELERTLHFKGMRSSDFRVSEKEVEIRSGFKEAWTSAESRYVISLNWSREFVDAVITDAAGVSGEIHCNALEMRDGVATGLFGDDKILTGSDKIRALEKILEKVPKDGVFYVGDNESDLLSILYPGIHGVVMGNEKKWRKIATLLGIELDYDKELVVVEDAKEHGSLMFAKGWEVLM